MIIFLFGGKNCDNCHIAYQSLKFGGWTDSKKDLFVFVDIGLEQNDSICDKFSVDEIPHIVILDKGIQVLHAIGIAALPELLRDLKKHEDSERLSISD